MLWKADKVVVPKVKWQSGLDYLDSKLENLAVTFSHIIVKFLHPRATAP